MASSSEITCLSPALAQNGWLRQSALERLYSAQGLQSKNMSSVTYPFFLPGYLTTADVHKLFCGSLDYMIAPMYANMEPATLILFRGDVDHDNNNNGEQPGAFCRIIVDEALDAFDVDVDGIDVSMYDNTTILTGYLDRVNGEFMIYDIIGSTKKKVADSIKVHNFHDRRQLLEKIAPPLLGIHGHDPFKLNNGRLLKLALAPMKPFDTSLISNKDDNAYGFRHHPASKDKTIIGLWLRPHIDIPREPIRIVADGLAETKDTHVPKPHKPYGHTDTFFMIPMRQGPHTWRCRLEIVDLNVDTKSEQSLYGVYTRRRRDPKKAPEQVGLLGSADQLPLHKDTVVECFYNREAKKFELVGDPISRSQPRTHGATVCAGSSQKFVEYMIQAQSDGMDADKLLNILICIYERNYLGLIKLVPDFAFA